MSLPFILCNEQATTRRWTLHGVPSEWALGWIPFLYLSCCLYCDRDDNSVLTLLQLLNCMAWNSDCGAVGLISGVEPRCCRVTFCFCQTLFDWQSPCPTEYATAFELHPFLSRSICFPPRSYDSSSSLTYTVTCISTCMHSFKEWFVGLTAKLIALHPKYPRPSANFHILAYQMSYKACSRKHLSCFW